MSLLDSRPLIYLYCLLPAGAAVRVNGIASMDPEEPLELLAAGQLLAAISAVGDDFSESALNSRVGDLEWLSPRAVRHHEAVDALYAQCKTLLPLSFGAIFTSRERLLQRLGDQESSLLATLDRLAGREEWDLKLSLRHEAFERELRRESQPLREMEADLAGKPPGTAFMLAKKLKALEKRESQRMSAEVRARVHAALSERAVDARSEALPAASQTGQERLELRSAYLVDHASADALRAAVEALATRYAPLGYMFDLSGPWPAFSFAGASRQALS